MKQIKSISNQVELTMLLEKFGISLSTLNSMNKEESRENYIIGCL